MPFYDYQCTKCNHQLEALQKVNAEPLVDCPKCETASLKKLVSAPAFNLSGTGWYETDFKDNKSTTKAGAAKASPAKNK